MKRWVNQCHLGDCLETMRLMPDNCVDSIVTDPPYGLGFMGKKWDYDVPDMAVWAECLRVLKPGGHLLAFAGTRTQHRMACRIEDAGFEIRDMIAWVYGSGFPKSLDVSKAIDKAAGAERVITRAQTAEYKEGTNVSFDARSSEQREQREQPATASAAEWQGWGTALKPALEPITMGRKPFACTVAANVLLHGTGALNIDGSRVAGTDKPVPFGNPTQAEGWGLHQRGTDWQPSDIGRWPANLIHDGSAEVVALFPDCASGGYPPEGGQRSQVSTYGKPTARGEQVFTSNSGSASRFFYCAKASADDRNEGMHNFAGVQQDPTRKAGDPGGDNPRNRGAQARQNHHPTVKPTDLMRYLCRLVTPPGGIVLDPFMGSGSTGRAAVLEGFQYIGCERDAGYIEIARARIDSARRQGHQPSLDLQAA